MAGYGSLRSSDPYFDDPARNALANWSTRYEEVSSIIFKINNNATSLERTAKQIGTPNDSPALRDRIHQTEQQTNALIKESMSGLVQLAQASKSADRSKQLQVQRLQSDFKETLQRYNSLQKRIAEKARATVLKTPKNPFTDDDEESLVDLSDTRHLMQDQRQEQVQREQQMSEEDLEVIREREERIRHLEGDILDINQIFRDLAMLVHEQGETISSIEDNIVKAADNVEAGNTQLESAASYQRKSRRKLCILALILLVVGGVLAIIIYFSVKKK